MATLYGAARTPTTSVVERAELGRRFRFTSTTLPSGTNAELRSVRAVHPSLHSISAWISSVGAAIALRDLDGDGLPNDYCLVDPRSNTVSVGPLPLTGERFQPITLTPPAALYDETMAPMGCLPGDLNDDGRADLLVYYWGRPPLAFFRQPSARHAYVARPIVAGKERWYNNAGLFADINGDGYADLILGAYFPDSARILDTAAPGVESMQHSMSRAENGGLNRVLLSLPAPPPGSGREIVELRGAFASFGARRWTLAVGAADLDGDLLPEVYFANDYGKDVLLHNRTRNGAIAFASLRGERGLRTPSSKVLGNDSFKGMGVDFGDLNDDGILDIFVSNIAAEYALQESHFAFLSTGDNTAMGEGRAPYVDRSEPLGLSRSDWAWEARLADFDNDGTLEVLQAVGFVKGRRNRWAELQELATANDDLLHDPRKWPRIEPGDDLSGDATIPFYVRSKTGRYVDVGKEVGVADATVSRGIATADVDGDGDLDFAVANQWNESRFYRNDCHRCGAFLGLRLLLPVGSSTVPATVVRSGLSPLSVPTRVAIGASVEVQHRGRRLVGQVDGGNGHSGKRSPELHLGLGVLDENEETIAVILRWRDNAGAVHRETHRLSPGWHTVLLASGVSREPTKTIPRRQ